MRVWWRRCIGVWLLSLLECSVVAAQTPAEREGDGSSLRAERPATTTQLAAPETATGQASDGTPPAAPTPEEQRAQRNRERGYVPRPTLDAFDPWTLLLLDEIEDEEVVPLFGQGIFRQAILDRALRTAAGPQPVATPPPSYRLLPGDQFTVTYWSPVVAPQTVDGRVQPDGTVAFDPIGAVQVSGLSVGEFETLLTRLLRLKGPREATVRVSFTSLHAIRVGVTGEVRRVSTAVVLSGYATVIDALAAAGGPGPYASLRHIRLYRDGRAQEIDLYQTLLDGDPAADLALRDGDRLHLPLAETLVEVTGQVARQRRYELTNDRSLRSLLAMAGSLQGVGSRVQVSRYDASGRARLWDMAVAEVLAGQAAHTETEPLQNGDQVKVLTASATRQTVEVRGAVGLPGEYGYRPGLTLGEAVTLAQGVVANGHAPIGTIRRLSANGQFESLNFQVAELSGGGAVAELPLQVGDVIEIPRIEDQPKIRVMVSGAVNLPGPYEMNAALTVSDLLNSAGGLAPGAATEGRLLSTASGRQTETRIDLGPLSQGGEPVPNVTLSNGDRLLIPTLRETGALAQVRVDGFVRTPGRYPLTAGLRLGDLLRQAGGLLPRAARRGKLVRVVPGTGDTTVQYVDFERALAGDEAENPALQEDDQVVVDSAAGLLEPVAPEVSIRGPVARPGTYQRYVGMRVSDLLREAGGLHREANREQAVVIRQTDSGRIRRLTFSPERAMAGDDAADITLQNGDAVELEPWSELGVARPMVRIAGAVYTPGTYPLTADMTLDELVHLGGGPTPEAYLPRALLYRRAELGRTRQIPFDLTLRPLDMPLEDGDLLKVFTNDEARYQEPTVEIQGEVRHEGAYERTEGMRLSDLIFVAGGLLREVQYSVCEVARPRSRETVLLHPDLAAALAGDEAQNLTLEDGDKVYIRVDGEYRHAAREVLLRGLFERPGFYPLSNDYGQSLRELVIDRAGGIREDGFADGAILLRRIDQVVQPEAARYVNAIYDTLRLKKRRDDYALAASKAANLDPDRLRAGELVLPTEVIEGDLAATLGDPTAAMQNDLELLQDRLKLTDELNRSGTSPAGGQTVAQSLQAYVRLSLNLPAILAGRQDLDLRPNDILIVGSQPETVLMMGEVSAPLALPFVERQTVKTYLQLAGGGTRDADLGKLLIVRADGTLSQAAMNTIVGRGDMVIVPPKPLVIPRDRSKLEDVQAVASILGGFATTILAVSQVF